jgi:hypothetical protein
VPDGRLREAIHFAAKKEWIASAFAQGRFGGRCRRFAPRNGADAALLG